MPFKRARVSRANEETGDWLEGSCVSQNQNGREQWALPIKCLSCWSLTDIQGMVRFQGYLSLSWEKRKPTCQLEKRECGKYQSQWLEEESRHLQEEHLQGYHVIHRSFWNLPEQPEAFESLSQSKDGAWSPLLMADVWFLITPGGWGRSLDVVGFGQTTSLRSGIMPLVEV